MSSQHTTSLSLETVRHIADLSRLALSSEEEVLFQKELEKVLNAFQHLTKVPLPAQFESRSAFLLEAVGGMDSAVKQQNDTFTSSDNLSHMAADVPNNSLSTQQFMANAPDKEGVFIRVPIILNQEN